MMYKSQFWKMYPYDWFCGPGSQMRMIHFIMFMHSLGILWWVLCWKCPGTFWNSLSNTLAHVCCGQAWFWVQVMRDLRNGVKLKKVQERQYNLLPIEFQLTPYEMLMDDIRSKRYKLRKVMVSFPGGSIYNHLKTLFQSQPIHL